MADRTPKAPDPISTLQAMVNAVAQFGDSSLSKSLNLDMKNMSFKKGVTMPGKAKILPVLKPGSILSKDLTGMEAKVLAGVLAGGGSGLTYGQPSAHPGYDLAEAEFNAFAVLVPLPPSSLTLQKGMSGFKTKKASILSTGFRTVREWRWQDGTRLRYVPQVSRYVPLTKWDPFAMLEYRWDEEPNFRIVAKESPEALFLPGTPGKLVRLEDHWLTAIQAAVKAGALIETVGNYYYAASGLNSPHLHHLRFGMAEDDLISLGFCGPLDG